MDTNRTVTSLIAQQHGMMVEYATVLWLGAAEDEQVLRRSRDGGEGR
ncbi:hypothetical protein ABZS71_33955 [Streptomyces sp. NPDC005393]